MTAMTYAMKFLRTELNKEMAWQYSCIKDLSKGRKVKPERSLEMKKREREERIVSIRMAIHVLKLAKKAKHISKPEYYWLNPKL